MISRIKMLNFQSHKESILEFCEGVNVIIGTTDSGKSSILRSIYWVNENRPLGLDSIQNSISRGEVEVEIKTDDFTITRKKGKNDEYRLSGIKDPFKAIGTSVPDEIKQALNLLPINYQKQIDAPFLFSNSPGYVAEHFNKMSNIQVTDTSIQYINSELNRLSASIGKSSEKNKKATGLYADLEKWKSALNSYDFLEHMEIELEVLEQMEKDSTTLSSRIKKIEKLINNIRDSENEINELQKFLNLKIEVVRISGLIESRNDQSREIKQLSELIEDVRNLETELNELENLVRLSDSVESIGDLISQKTQLSSNISKLKNYLYNIEVTQEKLKETRKIVKSLEKEFEENMPDVCPLCGRSD